MRACPQARLVVHPRGARHMADPSKLVAGAAAVHGAAEVRHLYGDILPIDPARIVEAPNDTVIRLADRELLCIDTPGHARHHICIVDRESDAIFTGDTFGLSYRELDVGDRQFIFPTTTPVQFDPDEMHRSIDRLMAYNPRVMYLTHFSELRNVEQHAASLHRLVDEHIAIARRKIRPGPDRHARIRANLAHLLVDEVTRFGCTLAPAEVLQLWEDDSTSMPKGWISGWIRQRNSRRDQKTPNSAVATPAMRASADQNPSGASSHGILRKFIPKTPATSAAGMNTVVSSVSVRTSRLTRLLTLLRWMSSRPVSNSRRSSSCSSRWTVWS